MNTENRSEGPPALVGEEGGGEEKLPWPERVGVWLGQLMALLAIVALPILTALICYHVYQAGKISADVNPINTIFASRIVVGAVRIGILVALVYAIVSMIVWAMRGEFLTAAGPIQIGKSARAAAEDRDRLAEEVGEAGRTIAKLEQELEDVAGTLETTGQDLDAALAYIDTLEAERKG